MSTGVRAEQTRIIRADQAAEWFLRLREDDVSEAELAEWFSWCADPENLREFQALRNTWRGFEPLRTAGLKLLEGLAQGESVPRSIATPGSAEGSNPSQFRAITRRRTRIVAMAAAFGGIAIVGLWYAMLTGRPHDFAARTTIRSTVLPDGSTLTLAPRTSVSINFSGPRRTLEMPRGEAFFKVQPNALKPFVVHTADLSVTAVGTAFDVRSGPDRIVVTVQEGVVAVARTGVRDGGSWRVSDGYQITYDPREQSARITAVQPDHVLAWREGRLEYFSQPIGAVVAEVSRYSSQPIEIGDPELAKLTFTGTVFISSIADWLRAVQTTFPIRAVIAKDGHVVLLNVSTAPDRPTP